MPFQKSVALKRLVVRDLLSVPNSCLSAFCRMPSWRKNKLWRFAIHRLGRKTGFGVLPFTVPDEKWSSAFCRMLSRMKNGLRRFAERRLGELGA